MSDRSNIVRIDLYQIILAGEVGLPLVWLGLHQEWARTIWVGLMLVMSLLGLFVLSVRAYSLKFKTAHNEAYRLDHSDIAWGRQIFHLFLNIALAFIMAKYAEHPFIAALILVNFLALMYEMIFNNK